MNKYLFPLMFLTIVVKALLLTDAYATTVTAESCSLSHVQFAIKAANTGDTVLLPAGSNTWSSSISIPNNKKITLKGSGMKNTVITMSPTGTAMKLNCSGSRITDIGLINGSIEADGYDFRIDHCSISFSAWSNGISVMSRNVRPAVIPTGVIDNCVFNNIRVLVCGTNYMLSENDAQHGLWTTPLRLGTAEAVYIEDNTFTNGVNAIDGNYGGRYVFRYNVLNDVYIEAHSVQGNNRAIRKWEIYNNTINQVSKAMWVPMFIRGGTGVIFNNILTGTWTNPNIAIDNVRSCYSAGDGGMCNGNSSWDGNEAGENGYPCRDQIGRSTDQWLWTTVKPYPPQTLDPAYAWNNKHGNNNVVFYHHNCDMNKTHIKVGRDIFNGVQKPGYAPYTYPHPLRATDNTSDESEPSKPSSPTGLKITD